MKIQILGLIGHSATSALKDNLIAAIGQMGIIVRLEEMHDIDTFLNYNLSGIPAMTINGQLAFEQQVPAIEDLMEQLGQHVYQE